LKRSLPNTDSSSCSNTGVCPSTSLGPTPSFVLQLLCPAHPDAALQKFVLVSKGMRMRAAIACFTPYYKAAAMTDSLSKDPVVIYIGYIYDRSHISGVRIRK
jgi:hypothetical protein